MLFQVTLMRFHGKALDQHQIRSAEAVRANIIISHQNVTVLGRYSDVASAHGGQGNNDALLPELYDCRLPVMPISALCRGFFG